MDNGDRTMKQYTTIYTGVTGWKADLDRAASEGYVWKDWLTWQGNHMIIMERDRPES
jgi:hypothetical protein